jgi:hypothetical protein
LIGLGWTGARIEQALQAAAPAASAFSGGE